MGEYARRRKMAQVPPLATGVNVGDSLREHGVQGREAALPVRIERSRHLKTEMVGTPMAGPTLDNAVECFFEPITKGAKRVIWR